MLCPDCGKEGGLRHTSGQVEYYVAPLDDEGHVRRQEAESLGCSEEYGEAVVSCRFCGKEFLFEEERDGRIVLLNVDGEPL